MFVITNQHMYNDTFLSRLRPNMFSYMGTKDKRAITVQEIAVLKWVCDTGGKLLHFLMLVFLFHILFVNRDWRTLNVLHLISAGCASAVSRQMICGWPCSPGAVIKEISPVSPQDHRREAGSPQQVPHEPEAGQLQLQKPSSETRGAAGKPFHCGHQVRMLLSCKLEEGSRQLTA